MAMHLGGVRGRPHTSPILAIAYAVLARVCCPPFIPVTSRTPNGRSSSRCSQAQHGVAGRAPGRCGCSSMRSSMSCAPAVPGAYLPREYPPWQTAYTTFRQWRLHGVWQRVHEALRRAVRLRAGRHADPSAAIMDSQSVKTTEESGWHQGL